MGLRRLLCAVIVCAAAGGVLSGRALAVAPPPCSPDSAQRAAVSIAVPPILREVSSVHFDVWFTGDPTVTNYATDSEALAVTGFAEQAYAAYAALGFPPPLVDPSTGKIEIYIVDLSTFGISSETCNGSFYFASGLLGQNDENVSTGWDVFAQIELTLFAPPAGSGWLYAGAAEWAAAKVFGYPSETTTDLGPPVMSLDCWDDTTGSACSKTSFEDLGESRWPFYEYLAERFGTTFIDEVMSDAHAAGSSLVGLENALVAHGTTLAAEYEAYSTKLMAGGWTGDPALGLVLPTVSDPPILTGAATGDIAAQTFSVDHLATRYIEFERGDGSAQHACFAASLTVTVQIPSGVTSQPTFYWSGGGSSPVPLSISGSTATATVPWDTCLWQSYGYLSLPNATTNVNSANFVVSAHLAVDTTTPATASPPPAASSTYGQIINVGSASVSPDISIFGPQILKLSSAATQIRLIVESDGEGSVKAALGSLPLGTDTLRPGENDLRFSLPKSALAAVRRSADATMLLTLTPLSPEGTVTGKTVTQQVAITPTAKAAAAPKAKAKTHSKPKHSK